MEQLLQHRSIISDIAEGIEISIPSPRHWFVVAFLGVWLGGWAMGEISALQSLFGAMDSIPAAAFLLVWLAGWTAAGAFSLYLFLWMIVGRERILVRADSILIRREILGLGRVHTYDLMNVRNMRVEVPRKGGTRTGRIGWGLIAFDHKDQTVRFGMVFSPDEAQLIVDRIKGRVSIASSPPAPQAS